MAGAQMGTVAPQAIHSYRAEGGAIGAGLAVMAGTAKDQAKLATGANVRCIGVTAQKADAAGDPLPVVELGEVVAVADAAITRGDALMANAATGRIAPIGAVAGTNYHTIGFALEGAVAAGDEFLMIVAPSRSQG